MCTHPGRDQFQEWLETEVYLKKRHKKGMSVGLTASFPIPRISPPIVVLLTPVPVSLLKIRRESGGQEMGVTRGGPQKKS